MHPLPPRYRARTQHHLKQTMGSVRIRSVDRVVLPPPHRRSYPAPGNTVPLSFFDTYWITLPPIQRLFLYPETNSLPFSSIVQSLKSSLSQTLLKFHPLAGKLTHLPSSADVIIDCGTDDAGVEFVVAECDGEIRPLAGDQIHDSKAFIALVPELDTRALPMAVMAVQATEFVNGGGVAVGLSLHHTVADGKGVWQFVEAWAAACRGEEKAVSVPMHDRAVIGSRHAGGDEIARRFLRDFAPDLPQMASHSLSLEHRLRLRRRTFTLSSSAVQSLKQRILDQSDGSDHPSTFTVLSAHAWACIARARATAVDVTTILIFLADCRSRLRPPLPDSYTGNCVSPCYASATCAALLGPTGLSRAWAEVARATREGTRDPLAGCETWAEDLMRVPESDRVTVSGSSRFRVYETDFGWGKPGRAELVSMNKDGEVVLVGGRDPGSVQVSVALDQARMGLFAEVFADGLEV